ncbi:hypothetical protein [Dapis sp. BLCC M172]|uniref:hypothetical protein n=1 Tax=Dapis sp. BLCC M172 TaxID=2975281 RepID=UPI003CEC6925
MVEPPYLVGANDHSSLKLGFRECLLLLPEIGDRQQSFNVFAFEKNGQTRVFNSYKF